MRITSTRLLGTVLALWLLAAGCAQVPRRPSAETLTTRTADGVLIHGEPAFADLGVDAPLILLFHQGGSSGRAEYGPLLPWLNAAGFRAIAWDQRTGGDVHGGVNRTAAGLAPGTPAGYCDASADLEAALACVIERGLAERVIVWGSSYSAALVVQLAAGHPERVAGVLACSPPSGDALLGCRARLWIDEVSAPVLVLRPASEMERASAQEQRDLLTAAGAAFEVIDDGVHGSSMFVDARTGHDMGEARAFVLRWLQGVVDAEVAAR